MRILCKNCIDLYLRLKRIIVYYASIKVLIVDEDDNSYQSLNVIL